MTYTFDYDAFGRPTRVRVGEQTLTTNVYTDGAGDKLLDRVEYGNGGKIHYTYDRFHRIAGIRYDEDIMPRFTYDYSANGQTAYVRDSELNRTVFTEFDTSERPIRTHVLESETSASTGTPVYVSTIQYDAFGHVSAHKESVNRAALYETTYEYDTDNRPTSVRYGADNRRVLMLYDSLNRVDKRGVVGDQPYWTQYTYVNAPQFSAQNTTPLVEGVWQSGNTFQYAYDNMGNIISETRMISSTQSATTTYEYDKLGQLTRVNDPNAGVTWIYTYDRGGNMLTAVAFTYAIVVPLAGRVD